MTYTVTTTTEGTWSVSSFRTLEDAQAFTVRLDKAYAESGLPLADHRIDEMPEQVVASFHALALASIGGAR